LKKNKGVGDRSNVTFRKKFVKKFSRKVSHVIEGGLAPFIIPSDNLCPSDVITQIEPPLSPRALRALMPDQGVPK